VSKDKRIESYSIEEVHREALVNAPYNPRVLSSAEKRKLKNGIKKLGLLSPPVWNKRTGNIVGGHQRIGIMDDMYGTKDYMITVAAVDLDETKEKEANILLNNAMAQGSWDIGKLGDLIKTPGLDLEATGFGIDGAFRMFGDAASDVLSNQRSEQVMAAVDEYDKMADGFNRAAHGQLNESAEQSPEFYFLAIFRTKGERDEWLDSVGLDVDRYQSGDNLRRIMTREEK
jgi:hypothetical protein